MTDANSIAPAIDIQGLSKAYGRTVALRNLDLQVPWGQVLTVLGPNGAGKTTLIKILATLSKPDEGSVKIAGWDLHKNGQWLRGMIGVVTHDPLLYNDLTGHENLRFAARMFPIDNADERIESVTQQLGVTTRLNQKVGTLSHGWKKRISLARALLHDPSILLMDEPESGLDQQALTGLEYIVNDETRPSRAIILTTHNFERGLFLGDQIAILAKGRLAYCEPTIRAPDPDTLRERYVEHVGVGQ